VSDTPRTDAAMCVLHPGVQPSTWYVQAEKCRELERELAAARSTIRECDSELSRVLHELAGAASLCWEPKPSGVFNTTEALTQVKRAINELRSILRRDAAKEKEPTDG